MGLEGNSKLQFRLCLKLADGTSVCVRSKTVYNGIPNELYTISISDRFSFNALKTEFCTRYVSIATVNRLMLCGVRKKCCIFWSFSLYPSVRTENSRVSTRSWPRQILSKSLPVHIPPHNSTLDNPCRRGSNTSNVALRVIEGLGV